MPCAVCTQGRFLSMDVFDGTIWCGPTKLMDIFVRTKFQEPLVMDQMSLWMFWTGPSVLQGLEESKRIKMKRGFGVWGRLR